MKIKRYIANDSQEAMMKVKAELGLEAVILHIRKIKKPGLLGFFKKPLVEVVAAIEEKEKKVNIESNVETQKNIKIEQPIEKISEIQNQLDSMQGLILDIINKNDKNDNEKDTNVFDKYLKIMLENDVEKQIAIKILNIAQKQIKFTQENDEAIKKAIRVIMKEYLGPPKPIDNKELAQKTIIFVGPTGVGKTTTLAKLAAKLSITNNKAVGLITADTYRIAAVEQLRTYSEILGVPLKVIYDPSEIRESIDNFKEKEILFIDTAGRNHKMEDQLIETKKMINNIPNAEVYLVISATTSYKDIKSIIQSYSFVEEFKLIFTKLDESTTFGNILNTRVFTGKDIAYFTTGQIVPDDIEIASPEKIVNLIVGE